MDRNQSPDNPSKGPLLILWAVAILAGVAWRAELESRGGWYSLRWVGYFHWAVPAGILAFIVWVIWVTKVRRPVIFAGSLLLFAAAAYVAVEMGLRIMFTGGPSGMLILFNLGGGDLDLGLQRLQILMWVIPVLWALIPVAFFGVCRLFGVCVRLKAALVSTIGFPASWFVGMGLYEIMERGSQDLLHGLKSGWMIPLLILCLGLPLLRPKLPAERGEPSSLPAAETL